MSTATENPIITAPRGTHLHCKGWVQEAALRMLMNNLDPDVAERPEDLVVYGGLGKAARNWDCFNAIVKELKHLGDDETLLVQSGKAVGVVKTHAEAPRVSNRMGRLGSGDQQLAGHAAHPRAGGTINTALDGQHLGRVGQRGAVGRHAGGAGADDGDVGVDRSFCVHGIKGVKLTGPGHSGRDGRRGAALAANGTCDRWH